MNRRTESGLAAEVLPFPVEPKYRFGPDLRRLEPGSRHFVSDAQWPRYLARKLSLLEADANRCRVIAGDEQPLMVALWQLAELLAVEQPHRFRLEDDRFTIEDLDLSFRRDGSNDDGSRQNHTRCPAYSRSTSRVPVTPPVTITSFESR